MQPGRIGPESQREGRMWIPVMTAALTAGQWFLDRERHKQEKVPEQLLTNGYFEAMADDIEDRMEEGLSMKEALKQVYGEQAPVLLRPAPKRHSKAAWTVVPLALGAAVALGLAYRSRR